MEISQHDSATNGWKHNQLKPSNYENNHGYYIYREHSTDRHNKTEYKVIDKPKAPVTLLLGGAPIQPRLKTIHTGSIMCSFSLRYSNGEIY